MNLGIMATWTFHEYLKRYANIHISWDHRQMKIDALPRVKNFTLVPKVNFSIRIPKIIPITILITNCIQN